MFDLFRHNTMIKSGHQHRQDLTELTLLQIEIFKNPLADYSEVHITYS